MTASEEYTALNFVKCHWIKGFSQGLWSGGTKIKHSLSKFGGKLQLQGPNPTVKWGSGSFPHSAFEA